MIRLKCLGGLNLDSDDVVIPASARQRRRLALLVVLARSGTGITRDRLMALLWPESSTESARHALDQLLYATRRDLGKTVLISEGPQLRLNPELLTSDVAQFEALMQDGDVEAAVGLYDGPFLDGVHLADSPELEQWLDTERTVLHEKHLQACERLANSSNDPGSALRWWKRRMMTDPSDSAGALALIKAYVAVGDHVGALTYAEQYCSWLQDEIGAEPSPEIRSYVEQLQAAVAANRLHIVLPRMMRIPRQGIIAAAAGVVLLVAMGARALSHAPAPKHVAATEAMDLYMRGRAQWNLRSQEGLERAVVMFRRATERDPLFADPYAGLAEAYALLGYHGFMPAAAAFPKAKAAALQALRLNPKLGAAHTALGIELQWERKWQEAERALQRAVKAAPDYATAHQHYALLLKTLRRNREALDHAHQAARLDPLSVQINNTYAVVLETNGMRDSALAVYNRIVINEPDTAWVQQNPWVLANFAGAAARAGQHEVAIRLINRSIAAVPGHPRPLADLAHMQLAAGDTAEAQRTFDRINVDHPLYPAYRAFFFAQLGDVDSTFLWFDRVQEWSPMLVMKFAGVRSGSVLQREPRYARLQQRLGLD